MCVIQRQSDAEEHAVRSYAAAILDLDLYADDDNDDVSVHAADVSASHLTAAETSHETHPCQPPPTDGSAATAL